jgi:hypothetical protein
MSKYRAVFGDHVQCAIVANGNRPMVLQGRVFDAELVEVPELGQCVLVDVGPAEQARVGIADWWEEIPEQMQDCGGADDSDWHVLYCPVAQVAFLAPHDGKVWTE